MDMTHQSAIEAWSDRLHRVETFARSLDLDIAWLEGPDGEEILSIEAPICPSNRTED